jgi:hypothetical protein
MDEQRCTSACRRMEVTGDGPHRLLTISRSCDHLPPRVLVDAPQQMGLYVTGPESPVSAGFKVQCRDCRMQFGGFWTTEAPTSWPPDPELLRAQGRAMLVADECLLDADGWRCGACLGRPTDARLALAEGELPHPLEGWPF